MTDLTFVAARELGGDRLSETARLNLAAMTDMYATLSTDRAVQIIASDLTNMEGELGTSMAVQAEDGTVVGFFAGFPANELPLRQQSSLYGTMSMLSQDEMPAFIANARALSGVLPPLERPGYYLARIAVDLANKGSGLGQNILKRFIDDARQSGAQDASLHVRVSNARAIAFYRRAGFQITASTPHFAIMTLPLAPEVRR